MDYAKDILVVCHLREKQQCKFIPSLLTQPTEQLNTDIAYSMQTVTTKTETVSLHNIHFHTCCTQGQTKEFLVLQKSQKYTI